MSWDILLAYRIWAQVLQRRMLQRSINNTSCLFHLFLGWIWTWACSRQVWWDWRFLMSSRCAGEAGVSPAQQEVSVSGPLSRISEAVHLSGPDQDARVTQTPKRVVPRQNTRQRPRLQVWRVHGCVMHADVVIYVFNNYMCLFRREEWQWLQSLSSLEDSAKVCDDVQSAPHRLLLDLRTAAKDLLAYINIPNHQVRTFTHPHKDTQLVWLHEQINAIYMGI